MAKGYRRVDRDQQYLLPVDMADWLPADHLVWFVIRVVGEMDTTAFHARARLGGVGRQGFDPDMLLTLLIYGYCHGLRSSRRIEQACRTDVAYRIICAQQIPDHTVIARFRRCHEDSLAELFTEVLRLCARAGLGRLGLVTLDGTKVAADASSTRTRDEDGLRRLAARVVAEAGAADAAEDAVFGSARGDQIPAELADAATAAARIQALLDDIAAERAARAEQAKADRVEVAQRRLVQVQATLERWREVERGKAQAWTRRVAEARAAGRRVRGAAPKGEENFFVRRQRAIVEAAQAAVDAARAAPAEPDESWQPRRNLTDPDSRVLPTRHGWIQGYNCQLAVSEDHLILTAEVCQDTNDWRQFIPTLQTLAAATTHITAATGGEAKIGCILADAGYASAANLTAPGPDRLIAIGKHHTLPRDTTDPGPPPTTGDPRDHMAWRLRHRDNAARYRRRAGIAEPINAHLKDGRGLRRFARRGLTAARSELRLAAAVTNLLRLRAHLATT